MNRKVKISILLSLIGLDSLVTILIFVKNIENIGFVFGALDIILVICLLTYMKNTKNSEAIYKNELKQILKCYDTILIKSNNFPKLADKDIIMIATIEDLVDAQGKIRKPVYYKEELGACSFILIDGSTACVYILKENHEKASSLEIIMEELVKAKKNNKDIDVEALEKIERTTIVMLEDNKAFKISPIKGSVNSDDASENL